MSACISDDEPLRLDHSPGVVPSDLCGRISLSHQAKLGWLSCEDTQKAACFSDERTAAEIRPAGYQPSMSALHADTLIKPGISDEEVLVVNRTSLGRDFHLDIYCGPGDSIIKDHFFLGKTHYLSDWWNNNYTITWQIIPWDHEGNQLGVGTYWCERYVEESVNPVVSGRLHVATSEDMYVLTAPEDRVVEALRVLLSDDTEYNQYAKYDQYAQYDQYAEYDAEYEDEDHPSSAATDEIHIVTVLEYFLRSAGNKIQFLALYDLPYGLAVRQESIKITEGTPHRQGKTMVSLIIEANGVLNNEIENVTQNEVVLEEVFNCDDVTVKGHIWRRSSNVADYVASEPACVLPGLPALVERRCRPSFERGGARWGPFCAAGVCEEQLHRCEPLPASCPPGFTNTVNVSSDAPSGLCLLLLPGVTFEERGSACRRQDTYATPWFPRQKLLELSFLSSTLANQTLWLPFRRLWHHGQLLPEVLSLLNRDDRAAASLNSDLNCTVVTPRRRLASSSCSDRHAVLCATIPLYSYDGKQRASVTGSPCQILTELGYQGAATGLEPCFTFVCPNTSSSIAWSEASSLCTKSNSSLASLTSQRQLDAIIRLGRAHKTPARTAVNLERRDGQVVWGNGTPLSYPALSPSFRDEQHVSGILDTTRGQYDFVRGDQDAVSCALCGSHVQIGPPELVLFYGDSRPGASIFAKVTNIQRIVPDWEEHLACFVSTAEAITESFQQAESSSDSPDDFRVKGLYVKSTNDDSAFIELSPTVDFGYLTCGLLIPELAEQITSNSLALVKQDEIISLQEYVIGIREGQRLQPPCDIAFCGATCSCFNQSFNEILHIHAAHGEFSQQVHPIRATLSNDDRLVAHYYVTLNFWSRDQDNVTEPDGIKVLRDEFGARLQYVKHARCCPAERTDQPVLLNWPRTCGGASTSVELCMDGSGRPAIRRCLGSPLTGVQWEPVDFHSTSCAAASDITIKLHQLSQVKVTAANSIFIATELEKLTSEPAALLLQDLSSAAVTLEDIKAGLEGLDPPLQQDLPILQQKTVTTVSHLMDVDHAALADITEMLSVGPRVVHAIERIACESFAESAPNVTADNVAVLSGDFLGVSSSAKEMDGSSLRTMTKDTAPSALFGVETAFLFESKKPDVPVVFLVYRDGRLLQSRGQRVTSQVVSALLPSKLNETKLHSDLLMNGTQLHGDVLMSFRSLPGQCAPTPVCVFWDTAASRWSTQGCWLEKVHNGSDVCRCNHLTNFARIFNFEPDEYLSETFHYGLDVTTYVGIPLSLLGLFLTVITYVCLGRQHNKRLPRTPGISHGIPPERHRWIAINMYVALAGMYGTFLGSLAAKENHGACVCLSASLHFFLLATFGWMTMEAAFQYVYLVKLVGNYISMFRLKTGLLVWVGSLVPVICVLATNLHCYDGQPDVCWMDFDSFKYAVALPLGILLLVNIVLFGFIINSIFHCTTNLFRCIATLFPSCCDVHTSHRMNQSSTNQLEQQTHQRRRVVFCIVLLGLPWVLFVPSIREARYFFAILFCSWMTVQGEIWKTGCFFSSVFCNLYVYPRSIPTYSDGCF